MEGMVSTGLRMVTGVTYNVGDRWGVQGFETIREGLRSDAPWWNIVGGASLSVFANTFASLDPFYKAMRSAITDDGQAFNIKVEDFVDAFKEISTVSSGSRLYDAFMFQRWLSKKDTYLSDVTKAQATFMTLTGLQPQEISDAYILRQSLKDQKARQDKGEQLFIRDFRRGLRIGQQDPDGAKQFFTRAFVHLHLAGYPEERFGRAIAIASENHETMVERINWDYYFKHAPKDKFQQRMNQYINIRNQR